MSETRPTTHLNYQATESQTILSSPPLSPCLNDHLALAILSPKSLARASFLPGFASTLLSGLAPAFAYLLSATKVCCALQPGDTI